MLQKEISDIQKELFDLFDKDEKVFVYLSYENVVGSKTFKSLNLLITIHDTQMNLKIPLLTVQNSDDGQNIYFGDGLIKSTDFNMREFIINQIKSVFESIKHINKKIN